MDIFVLKFSYCQKRMKMIQKYKKYRDSNYEKEPEAFCSRREKHDKKWHESGNVLL